MRELTWDQCTVMVTSADPMGTIHSCRMNNIVLRDLKLISALELQFEMSAQQLTALTQVLEQRGDRFQIRRRTGFSGIVRNIRSRPVLLCAGIFLLFLTVFLQGRILFVQVEGNTIIPDRMILQNAASSGIHLGASRRSVRSEEVKNQLLQSIPQLQWAGVNTKGCVAVIRVRENMQAPMQDSSTLPGHLIALRDGIIRSIVTTRGTALCVPGQAVKAGQILISGYSDLGLLLRLERAEGEIIAETRRELTVLYPQKCLQRGAKTDSAYKFSLIIGKKRINLWNSSGILDTTCVKIYSQKYMTLPGGYVLPICIVKEQYDTYQWEENIAAREEAAAADFAQNYLLSSMYCGRIEQFGYVFTNEETVSRFDGVFQCCERIGIISTEEQEIHHVKDH